VNEIELGMAMLMIEATGPGRGQASVLICASPWIDSPAHTVHDAIPRYKGHNCITSNNPKIKIARYNLHSLKETSSTQIKFNSRKQIT
jgi:hypothetical protein